MNALFKIRNENHIQCVIIGDFGQGKSATACGLAAYDSKFTRELLKTENWREFLKYGDNIHFRLSDNVIISPMDPASKFVDNPVPYNSYEVDEGYLWATTSEASTTKTRRFIDAIVQNRKVHPSFYHVYPNLFKMPSRVLELMNEVILKLYVNKGALLIPTRMVQLPEKFDREMLERFAKKPKRFEGRIKYHSTFVTMMRTPKWTENFHERYLAKYEKYKVTESKENEKKVDVETDFFQSLDKMAKQRTVEMKSRVDIKNLIQTLLKGKMDENSADSLSDILTDKYIGWKEGRAVGILTEQLKAALAKGLKFDKFEELIGSESGDDTEAG